LGTEGTGRDNGEILGQAIDANVQETADAAAQSENKKNIIPKIHRSFISPDVPFRLPTASRQTSSFKTFYVFSPFPSTLQ
jgi:hypothetical protein